MDNSDLPRFWRGCAIVIILWLIVALVLLRYLVLQADINATTLRRRHLSEQPVDVGYECSRERVGGRCLLLLVHRSIR